jgi:hypothetical protein
MRRRLPSVLLPALALTGLLSPAGPARASDAPLRSAPTAAVPETVHLVLDGLRPAAAPAGGTAVAAMASGLSAKTRTPVPFSMVGFATPSDAPVELRTSLDGETWTPWHTAEVDDADFGPDAGTTEAARATAGHFTEPVWVGAARWLQVRTHGAPLADLDVSLIDSAGLGTGASTGASAVTAAATVSATSTAPQRPAITTRAGWGADEGMRSGTPTSARSGVRYAVVHHTAGNNSYSPAQVPAVLRGILAFHTRDRGWGDIGYNLLVDRYGGIWEGRAGGIDRAVVGAHAQGFNTGSVGIAVLGDFSSTSVPAVADGAVADALAWVFKVHGVEPAASVAVTSGGSNKYPSGTVLQLPTIIGHRDVGQTACPGNYYSHLPVLRSAVAARLPQRSGTYWDTVNNVHERNIERLVAAGITAGCGQGDYCPARAVTRGQTAALLVRALPQLPRRTGQRFSDVAAGADFAAEIATAADAGIITGRRDGTFGPGESLTREQMASVLARAARLTPLDGRAFVDVSTSSPHLGAVNAVAAAGITTGCTSGRYCPARAVTRDQMASFIVRGLLDRSPTP